MTLPKTICMLPWISVETSPMGTTRVCCLSHDEITDETGEAYDLTKTDLETVYHSQHLQQLRQQFRAGAKPQTCKRCWDEEDAGRTSKRMHTQVRLKELYPQVDWQNDNPDQLWFVDLKLGNICNLKCRICGSWSSSKWAEEEMNYLPDYIDKKTHIAYTWLKKGAWPRKTTTFWDNMRDLLPNIKYMEFTGGEPWMIQEHFDLLQYAVDQGFSKNIDIHYNTNATQVPQGRDWDLWQQFRRVDIAFSIDNLGARFEYERYGAKWETAQQLVQYVNQWRTIYSQFTTQLCFTINIQNVYYLDQLLDWADQQNFGSIYFNMLHSPSHMSIQYMTPRAQELVLNKLKTTFWTTSKHQEEIDRVIKFIELGPGSNGREFLRQMQQTDRYRKQNFIDTHPEIAEAMGYGI
jgi:MoaA/NifB/PqqE/SkfB family radical SAM enzyme